eukprot:scaffold156422_cov22-Tisochrysis_lutea.AAC.1
MEMVEDWRPHVSDELLRRVCVCVCACVCCAMCHAMHNASEKVMEMVEGWRPHVSIMRAEACVLRFVCDAICDSFQPSPTKELTNKHVPHRP